MPGSSARYFAALSNCRMATLNGLSSSSIMTGTRTVAMEASSTQTVFQHLTYLDARTALSSGYSERASSNCDRRPRTGWNERAPKINAEVAEEEHAEGHRASHCWISL